MSAPSTCANCHTPVTALRKAFCQKCGMRLTPLRPYLITYWIVVWLIVGVAFMLSFSTGGGDSRANPWLLGGAVVATLFAASVRGIDEKAHGDSAFTGCVIGWLILVPLLLLAAFLGLMAGLLSTQ
jgi:drug/metabolite transporter (DMT)-like permease